MPEAEEGNRTEDGKIVQVRSNVAGANKWCKCGQMAKTEKMLLVRTKVADADQWCMFGKLVQITWAAKRQ